jgi:drug/metabolite transporter (DMT)-like permease
LKGPGLALLLVSVLWGTTFVAIKTGLHDAPPLLFVGVRFTLGALVALPLSPRRGEIRRALPAAVPLGLVLAVGYATQTLGLAHTTPARSAFVTGVNVAIVPLWASLLLRRRPRAVSVAGLAVTLPGLWLLTSPGTTGWGVGDTWTLVCAFAFALHVVLVDRWGRVYDAGALLAAQLAVTAVTCLAASLLLEEPRVSPTPSLAVALVVTAVFATAGTTWLQLRYQPRVDPTRAAVLYATEPVFAALFSRWILGEGLPGLGWAGGSLILAGTLLSELGGRRGPRRPERDIAIP